MELLTATDEDLLVELLNTTPLVHDVTVDVLDAGWLRAHGDRPTELDDLRALRSELQSAIRDASAPVALNTRLRELAIIPEYDAEGHLSWRMLKDAPSLGQRALLGWVSAASAHPGRLRACANDECNLFLLDRSRSGTGKWCSMATCGNRLKARRFSAKA